MKPKAAAKVKEISLTAVGLHYRLTIPKLKKMEEAIPLKVVLRREPNNEYDENAIAVWCVERPFKDVKIGYLKRGVAQDLAPKMDSRDFKPREVWITELVNEKETTASNGYVAELLVRL